jgi:hypothetical protein
MKRDGLWEGFSWTGWNVVVPILCQKMGRLSIFKSTYLQPLYTKKI